VIRMGVCSTDGKRQICTAAQIVDGFVGGFGDINGGQFAGADEAGQAAGIAFVGFEGSPGCLGMSEGAAPDGERSVAPVAGQCQRRRDWPRRRPPDTRPDAPGGYGPRPVRGHEGYG
jgi:hypothetical protein